MKYKKKEQSLRLLLFLLFLYLKNADTVQGGEMNLSIFLVLYCSQKSDVTGSRSFSAVIIV